MSLIEWVLTLVFFVPGVTTVLLGIGTIFQVRETLQSGVLRTGLLVSLMFTLGLSTLFLLSNISFVETPAVILFKSGDFEFSLSLFLDRISLLFLVVTVFFGSVVGHFSRRYMHREAGFRRFFFVISFFLFGMHLALLSSNLDILFAGWEIVGLSSYLLIAYYWEKEKPVRNAERVYWIYRICDVGLLMGAFFAHLVWREGAFFQKLRDSVHLVPQFMSLPVSAQWLMGILIASAALGKSAQFPFLTWLPRALEGPTPSSAIFYGALSIHMGVFLLIRMEPVWRMIPGFPFFIGAMGLISAFLATAFGRLQTTIKGQIAYSSSAQVGVMFFELALGLDTLVLIHFLSNSLFRGYQLLVAPSAMVDRLQLQSSNGGIIYRSRWLPSRFLPDTFSETLYLFSLNEGYIDAITGYVGGFALDFFSLFEDLTLRVRRSLHHYGLEKLEWIFLIISSSALWLVCFSPGQSVMVSVYSLVGTSLLFSLSSFLGRNLSPLSRLVFVLFNQYLIIMATGLLNPGSRLELGFCFAAFSTGFGMALVALYCTLQDKIGSYAYRRPSLVRIYPRNAGLFFVGAMTLGGSPLSFTFVSEDLIFHHLVPYSGVCAVMVCISYILNGGTLIRLFGSVFLCPEGNISPFDEKGLSKKSTFLFFILFIILQTMPFILWRLIK